MPRAQARQQVGQVLDDLGALGPVRLGAGRPHQVGGRLLHGQRFLVLRTVANGGDGQHLGPHLEQELADLVAHRHVVEHLAQLDGVLDRHRLLLLDLLRHAHQPLGRDLLGEERERNFWNSS
jgi:hypothetical protein